MDHFNKKISSILKTLDEKEATCELHGKYISSLMKYPGQDPAWTDCPACFQEKIQRENQQLIINERHKVDQQRFEKLMGRAAIPKRYEVCRFDNYHAETEGQAKALRSATKYCDDVKNVMQQGRSLMLVGEPGTGKTHLAIAIAHRMIDENYSALYVTANEVIDTVIEAYGEKGRRKALDSYRSPDVLIMDEVGRQKGSDHDRMVLFETISRRYDDMKPTILISNLNLDDLKRFLDDATRDRLRDNGGRVILFDWDSYRGRG